MSDEPNMRALERALTGQPQGWGEFPPGKPSRPMPAQAAEVAPAQACEPEPQPSPRATAPEEPGIYLTFKWDGGDGSFDRIYPGERR